MTFLLRLLRPLAVLLALVPLILAGCAAPPGTAPAAEAASASARGIAAPMPDARLGTQWGEDRVSRVSTLDLKRAGSRPEAVQEIRYSAAPGRGERLGEVALGNGGVSLRVLRADGSTWPVWRSGGLLHLQGRKGERYVLEYRNRSARTHEIVATVDGLDVLSGQPGSTARRGYVLRPGETLRIEGFRMSREAVAAFRFSAVPDAYAANTPAGSVANVGVIGTALFALIDPSAPVPPCGAGPCAFPGDGQGGYAPPPVRRN